MKVEPDGLSRRRVLTLLLPAGLGAAAIAWGDWLPLPRLAEGAEKGEKKKRPEKGEKEKKEEDEGEKEDKEEKGKSGKKEGEKEKKETEKEKKGTVTASQGPTDKDQCKEGGWRKFTNPSFKNQGECVSFVERRKHK